MKRLFLSFGLLVSATTLFAQSEKFVKGMEKNITLLDSSRSSEDLTNVAAAFERIGDAEKTQWLPYYYAALANILKGFADPKVNKEEVASQAEKLIGKAEELEPKNSELALLRNMA